MTGLVIHFSKFDYIKENWTLTLIALTGYIHKQVNPGTMSDIIICNLPGSCAVPVENIEVLAAKQFAPIHSWLDSTETTKDPDLLHVAHHRHDVKSLEFSIHCVETTYEMLKEKLESLRETQHCLCINDKGCYLLTTIINKLALISSWITGADWWWTVVRSGWHDSMMSSHEFQRRTMMSA